VPLTRRSAEEFPAAEEPEMREDPPLKTAEEAELAGLPAGATAVSADLTSDKALRLFVAHRDTRISWADMMSSDSDEELLVKDSCSQVVPPSPDSAEQRYSGSFDSKAHEHWASEVRELAQRLHSLAVSALPWSPGFCTASAATYVTCEDVVRWEASGARLAKWRLERAAWTEQVAAAKATALRLEARERQVLAKAAEFSAHAEDATRRRSEEQRSAALALRQDLEAEASAQGLLQLAIEDAHRRTSSERAALEALQLQLAAEVRTLASISAAEQQAAESRRQTEALPEVEARWADSKARERLLEEEQERLSGDAQRLQIDLNAVVSRGRQQVEALEERVDSLEQECREIRLRCAPLAAQPSGLTAADSADSDALQAQTQVLVAAAKAARAARDSAGKARDALRSEVEAARSWYMSQEGALSDLLLQQRLLVESKTSTETQVECQRAEIADLEHQTSAAVEVAVEARQRHAEVDAEVRRLALARRRAEDRSTLLEWRLRNTAGELARQAPDALLTKCLASSRPLLAASKRHGARLQGSGGTSRASTGLDAELSTTAGESGGAGRLSQGSL